MKQRYNIFQPYNTVRLERFEYSEVLQKSRVAESTFFADF